MNKINILITSVSGKVTLIEAFKEALVNEKIEGKIVGIDVDPYSAGLYFCNEYLVCPRLDDLKYLDFVYELCEKEGIKLIVPTRDSDVDFFSEHKHEFEKRGVIPMVPSFETAKICSDKYSFFEFLYNNDIPTIMSWKKNNDEVSLPCVIKDRTGAGARNFHIANTYDELCKKIKLVKNPIIQEFIEGVEYTVDYFSDFDSNVISVVPRIRLRVEGGESKIGITAKDEEIIELAKKLGTKLKLIGHNVIQCFKLKDGTIKFIEVNPRFGGGSSLCFASGVHTPTYLLQLLQNKKVKVADFKNNFIMMRYSKDYFVDDNNIIS